MAKPEVTLPDAERILIARLAGVATTVSTSYPDVTLTGTNTHLQVELENSDTSDYPVAERAQVRITGHAAPGKRTAVKTLMSDVLRELYTHPGNADLAGIVVRLGRSDVTEDPDTHNLMCWVLVQANLKATPVAP